MIEVDDDKYQDIAAAFRHLIDTDGWEYLCKELKAAEEIELENLSKAEDSTSVMRSAGIIQGLRRVLSIPDTYIKIADAQRFEGE